ncbi:MULTISPECIES: hypothetical protein [Novosphingobium]|uniref:Uncharacterized protein n=1 Tax=Novosphingobium mathurense TaxID=428990 RepID=A0A1U6GRS6_9SPHN|nr:MULTISPECIES: hypothetical protein [Novosphingobium]CDO37063.1 hypothetical protein SPHV1_270005 [Novosphingobium sp. KN65.2]SLJ86227.1 hypothetical protein SAMN06295987_101145 [Novosphingobium mathurense]
MDATKIGPEIPYRRKSDPRRTGSLIFDRERDDHVRDNEGGEEMKVWSGGHFKKN